jgi:hypothetical protein
MDRLQQLQVWLSSGKKSVTVPFAHTLAELIPPISTRLRRDFRTILSLIQTHALLHQVNRVRDKEGRIIACIDDYSAIHSLISDSLRKKQK